MVDTTPGVFFSRKPQNKDDKRRTERTKQNLKVQKKRYFALKIPFTQSSIGSNKLYPPGHWTKVKFDLYEIYQCSVIKNPYHGPPNYSTQISQIINEERSL